MYAIHRELLAKLMAIFLLKPVELSLSLPFWAFLGSEAACGLDEREANYWDLRHRYLGPYWPVFNVIQIEGLCNLLEHNTIVS